MKKNVSIFLAMTFIVTPTLIAAKQAHLIFLQGSCSSGTSSTLKALKEQNPSWHTISDDDTFYEIAPQSWRKRFPKKMALIESTIAPENILHAILWQDIQFRPETAIELKKLASLATQEIRDFYDHPDNQEKRRREYYLIKNTVLTEIENHLKNNETVVVDTWMLSSKEIKAYQELYTVVCIQQYCPLLTVTKRLLKRKKESLIGNMWHKRYLQQAFTSYFRPLKQTEKNKVVIDTISKEEILEAFALAILNLREPNTTTGHNGPFSRIEYTLDQLHTFVENKINEFSFDQNNNVDLSLKYPADLYIRSDKNSPEECAQKIINYIEKITAKITK